MRKHHGSRQLFVVLGALVGAVAACGQPASVPDGPPGQPSPTLDARAEVEWRSALVARDDATVTVHAGVDGCREIVAPEAVVTAHDATQVTIAVSARIVAADDCTTTDVAVPITLSLSAPLGARALADAATGQPRPVYFERHLPDLTSDSRWSSHGGTWSAGDPGWYRGYNGPDGLTLDLVARPTGPGLQSDPVDTVAVGPYSGTITEMAFWWVSWEVDDVTYSLRVTPREGGSITLDEFEQELARLTWS